MNNAEQDQEIATYQPGNLTVSQEGLTLSRGLSARVVARSGQRVAYSNSIHGTQSETMFHSAPDGAAIFPDNREDNPEGYIYVSNSEIGDKGGGVFATTFNAQGDVVQHKQVLSGTSYNCNGGSTP